MMIACVSRARMDARHLLDPSKHRFIESVTKEESEKSKCRSKRARAASATNTHDPLTTAN